MGLLLDTAESSASLNPSMAQEYTKDRDIHEQIAYAYRTLCSKLIGMQRDYEEDTTIHVDAQDHDKAEITSGVAIRIKELMAKNQKMLTKMIAAGLGE